MAATSYVSAIEGADSAEYKRVPNTGMLAEGSDGTGMYFAQINPATGGLITEATLDLSLYEAAGQPLAVRLSNGVSFLATDSGAGGTDVLRTILATRHEAADTPLAAQISDGTNFGGFDFGASSGALRTSALLGNALGAADFGSGAAGAQTLRVVLESAQDTYLSSMTQDIDAMSGNIFSLLTNTDPIPIYLSNLSDINLLMGLVVGALPLARGQTDKSGSLSVTMATDQDALPVTLATGAATEAKQDSGNTSLASIDGKLANSTGTAAVALRTVEANRSKVALVNQDLTGVTAAAYTEVVTALAAEVLELTAFETSGQGLILATGAAAAEQDVLYIPPGGLDGVVALRIASGTRLSVKALLADSESGDLVMNLLG